MWFFNLFKREPKLWVKIKKMDERAVMPKYAHHGDVGMDMTSISVEYDAELDRYIYDTGLAFESNFNVGQFLAPRSSNSKTEGYLTNSLGIADSAIYRGRIKFIYKNRDSVWLEADTASNSAFAATFAEELGKWDGNKKTWKETCEKALEKANNASKKVTDDIMDMAKNLQYAPYKVGERIGQMFFLSVPTVKLELVDELSETERGENGFGSTGK